MNKMCNKSKLNRKIRRFLRPILYLVRNVILKKRLSRIFNELPCIESGNYKILLSEKIIIYRDTAQEFVKQFEMIDKGFLKHLPSIKITKKYKNLNTTFCGQIAMLTANNDWKIFDIKKNQVLSILDVMSKEKYHNRYEVFQGKLVMTYLFDIKEGIVEKLIQNIPRSTWGHDLIIRNYLRILLDQLSYLTQATIVCDMTCLDILENIQEFQYTKLNEIGRQILDKINYDYKLPCVFLHCDVHFGNTLFDGRQLYYVDFEYASNEVFLYDIFNCMFVDFILNHDPFLLSLYIKKDINMFEYLYEIFNIMGMNFNEERYLDYLYIFLLARLRFTCVMLSKSAKYQKKRTLKAEIEHFRLFCNYLEEYDDKI